ncbi:hypothetical protein C8R45DRAFT_939568 [Mycena sanguinolenta]|nr:hypothetical protein C8R45DRAFT_939568 [Mycena sanguinolenta]
MWLNVKTSGTVGWLGRASPTSVSMEGNTAMNLWTRPVRSEPFLGRKVYFGNMNEKREAGAEWLGLESNGDDLQNFHSTASARVVHAHPTLPNFRRPELKSANPRTALWGEYTLWAGIGTVFEATFRTSWSGTYSKKHKSTVARFAAVKEVELVVESGYYKYFFVRRWSADSWELVPGMSPEC